MLALAVLLGAAAAAEAVPGVARPPIVGVSHIAFRVSDLARARAFYSGLLGYEETDRGREAGRPSGLRLGINRRQFVEIRPGLAAGTDDRLDHVAFETTDVAALRAYLEGRGLKAGEPVDDGGDRVLRLADPDGHAVEFVQYRPSSTPDRTRATAPGARPLSSRICTSGSRWPTSPPRTASTRTRWASPRSGAAAARTRPPTGST